MKIYPSIVGYVTVTLQGRELIRFLRMCSAYNYYIWSVECLEWNQIKFCICAKDFIKTKRFLRKTKSHICRITKHGMIFWVKGYQKKRFFFLSAVCSLGILYILSGYVWNIEVVGNSYLSQEMILDFLDQNNSGIGIKKKDISTEQLEKNMRTSFSEVIWNSVSLNGTTLHIAIKEQIQSEASPKKVERAKDLIAPADGEVCSLYVRNGTSAVTLKQKVKKGDVLVYGWVPILNDSGTQVVKYREKTADADVEIKGEHSFSHSIDNHYQKRIYSGKMREYYYIGTFFGSPDYIPILYGKIQSTKLVAFKPIRLMDTIQLPLNGYHIREKEYHFVEAKYTKQELLQLQKKYYNSYIEKLGEKGIQIVEKNVMITYGKEKCSMTGTMQCIFPAEQFADSVLPEVQNIGNEDL